MTGICDRCLAKTQGAYLYTGNTPFFVCRMCALRRTHRDGMLPIWDKADPEIWVIQYNIESQIGGIPMPFYQTRRPGGGDWKWGAEFSLVPETIRLDIKLLAHSRVNDPNTRRSKLDYEKFYGESF